MKHYHLPVLVWPDAAGSITAVLVGDAENAAAHADTLTEALRELKELVEWRLENEPWNVDPDFTQPELMEVKVEVLPQYTEDKRIIPCPETLWLRVPCVIGQQENGLPACALPHLGLRFTYQDAAGLKDLVSHYVKEALQGFSPLQLAGCLPPKNCRLENLVVRDSLTSYRPIPPQNRPELRSLFAVADPLPHDLGRKQVISSAYGREELSAALARKLGPEKANVLLVGEPGVGKSTLLVDAVKKLHRERSSAAGRAEEETTAPEGGTYRFWRGSGGRLIAGMRYLGEWEERCEEFIQQLSALDGVFCAENLLELVQTGGQGPGNGVAAFLLPYLQRGELRMVAEATPAEVEACRRLLPGLLDVFHVMPVLAFNDPEAVEALTRLANACLSNAGPSLEPGTIPLIYRLFKRFLPYTVFPGPAAHFVRALCRRRGRSEAGQPPFGTAQAVVAQFIQQTGLPEIFLRDELPLQIDEVRRHFEAQIIGQPVATRAAARLVTTIKAGLTDPERPLGVLLLCGPTGVGKTALAKLLADFCFGAGGQKDRLVRLDMSEYSGWGAATRLLQAAEGHPAPWIEQVRRQPFCVLLLDEIEKAAPEVFDVLLGLLDEGRLTDRFGRVTHFRSAIMILTSNLGSSTTAAAGFHSEAGPAYESEVAKFFRPEFFNRLDGVITFNPLTRGDVERITRKELADLADREGFTSAGLRLEWTARLVTWVAGEGYDHRLGARPLQRALERCVVTPLARWRVQNPQARDCTLLLDAESDGRLEIRVTKP